MSMSSGWLIAKATTRANDGDDNDFTRDVRAHERHSCCEDPRSAAGQPFQVFGVPRPLHCDAGDGGVDAAEILGG
jgi:hypothetical protein